MDQNVIYGLYCLCHPTQIRYVGQTSRGAYERLLGHTSMVSHREKKGLRLSHSQRWIKKHGPENIAIAVLEVCATSDELDAAENRWIESLEDLTNLRPGGDSQRGYKLSEEVSQSRRGEGNPMYGRNRSELMDRIRALRGPMSEENKKARAERLEEARKDPGRERKRIEGIRRSHNTPEFKARMSALKTGAGNPNYGRRLSEEDKRALSLSMSPFSEEDIRSIRNRRDSGEPQKSIAESYEVDPSTISKIVNRKRFGWVD